MCLVQPFFLDVSEDEKSEIQREVGRVLESGRLVLGPQTEAFEAEFAASVGSKYTISTSTGTSALEMILRAKDVRGCRVAVPTNTYFATVAAVLHAGGTPVMLDMEASTFMPTAATLERAIDEHELAGAIWVHIGWLIAPDFDQCVELCRRNGIFMFEDAAHAHASSTDSGQAGTLGDAAAFSFFPTKVMTTLEGGMITTDDENIATLCRSLRNQGKGSSTFGNAHIHLGNSWRLTEFSAAMSRVMLRMLPRMAAHREGACRALEPMMNELGLDWCRFDHMRTFQRLQAHWSAPTRRHPLTRRNRRCVQIERRHSRRRRVRKALPFAARFLSHCQPQPDIPGCRNALPTPHLPPVTSGTTPEDIEQISDAFRSVFGGVSRLGSR